MLETTLPYVASSCEPEHSDDPIFRGGGSGSGGLPPRVSGSSGITCSGSGSHRSSLAERRSGSLGRCVVPLGLDAAQIRNSRDKEQPAAAVHAAFRGWATTSVGHRVPLVPETVKVMTYNVLCPKYATTDRYPHCAAWELAEDYRCANILSEIRGADPDIIAFQEITRAMCESASFGRAFTSPEGELAKDLGVFAYCFFPTTDRAGVPSASPEADGVGIFFKTSRFLLHEQLPTRFNLLAEGEHKRGMISDEFRRRLCTSSHNVALTATLKDLRAPMIYVVGTTHTFYNQSQPEFQLWQLQRFLQQMTDIQETWSAGEENVATVLLGDINSEPNRAPIEFIRTGVARLSPNNTTATAAAVAGAEPGSSNGGWPVAGADSTAAATHSLRLASAYDEFHNLHPRMITHVTRDFAGVADYIFIDPESLLCTAVAVVPEAVVDTSTGDGTGDGAGFLATLGAPRMPLPEVPNQYVPSDHYPLAAMLVPRGVVQ